jgi:hypothetical protein
LLSNPVPTERSDEHDYDHPKRKIPEIRIQLRSCHSCDTHVIYRRYTRASIMIRGPVHKLVPPYHMMLEHTHRILYKEFSEAVDSAPTMRPTVVGRTGLSHAETEIEKWRAETGARNPPLQDRKHQKLLTRNWVASA